MHAGLHDDRPQGPVDPAAGLEQRGEERTGAELGDAQLHVAGLGGQQAFPGTVAVGGAGLGVLVAPGADRPGGLQVDEGSEHELRPLAQHVEVAARAHGVEQVGRSKRVEGHRGRPPS